MLIDKLHSLLVHDSQGGPIPVRIVVNSRSRRIILRLSPEENGAILVLPRESLRREGVRFAAERADWIRARLDLLPRPRPFADGALIPVRGVPTRLSLAGPGRITALTTPADPSSPPVLSSPGAPATFADRVHRFLKAQARADLEAAVSVHSARLGVEARRVTLKDTRSRWGSCTEDGVISFSWRIIFAPPYVLDYLAAHETAHLKEMNHSRRFWNLVAKCTPHSERGRAWLRIHGMDLHAFGREAA